MAESTLSGAYSDFRSEIASFLGYGRDSSNWSSDQEATILSVLKSGLRQFYHPPKLPNEYLAHQWSFLSPVAELSIGPTSGTVSGTPTYDSGTGLSTITAATAIFESRMAETDNEADITFDTSENSYTISSITSTTVAVVSGDASGETADDGVSIDAQYAYDLPDDFGGIDGPLTYSTNSLKNYVPVTSEKTIREKRSKNKAEGIPDICAIRPMTSDGTDGQRFEILFYPTPQSSYTLFYSYVPLLDVLTASVPYPWGGEPHTETVIASCVAVAEERLNDMRGEKWQRFMERLQASVDYDRQANSPENLGYNADNSVYPSESGLMSRRNRGSYNIVYSHTP